MSARGGGAMSTGSANAAIQAAATNMAARTFCPSAVGMSSSPPVGPSPAMNPA
jgi:hypothetical protein